MPGVSFSRIFVAVGVAVFLLATAAVGTVHYVNSTRQMRRSAEEYNAALARALGNMLRAEVADFLDEAHAPAPPIRVATIRRHIATAVQGTRVLKVNIYNRAGVTVFSTDPEQIGKDQSRNRFFLGALSGAIASAVVLGDQMNGLDGFAADRDLVRSFVPVRSSEGAVRGVFEIYTDVTEFNLALWRTFAAEMATLALAFAVVLALLLAIVQRNAKLMRRQHRANLRLARSASRAEAESRAKSELLFYLGRELRPALSAIIDSSAPSTEGREPNGRREGAGAIHALGTQLLKIVDTAVDLSRLEAGRLAVVTEKASLAPLIEEVVRERAQRAEEGGIALRYGIEGELPTLESDPHRIRQALSSILDDALCATPSGGAVVLRARPVYGRIEITVEYGDAASAVPDPRRRADSAIALRLGRGIVELIGGSFAIDSGPGAATRVRIALPLQANASAASSGAAPSGEEPRRRRIRGP